MEMRYDEYTKKCYTLEEWIKDSLCQLTNESHLEELYYKLPLVQIGYDSEAETLKHINRVSDLLSIAAEEILKRARMHDQSKLGPVEKPLFDEYTPKLKNCTYLSQEYNNYLKKLGVALKHHYEWNSHHPEHYENGIDGMDLFDLVEMFFDWKAATERHADGNINKSIKQNKSRFNMSEQLCNIFSNTAKKLGY